jgi:Cu/Ag efflux pump CusA
LSTLVERFAQAEQMMHRAIQLTTISLLCAAATGCSTPAPIVRVCYALSSVPDAPAADEQIARPLAAQFRGPDVEHVTTITTKSKLEIYLTATRGSDAEKLLTDACSQVIATQGGFASTIRMTSVTPLPDGTTVPRVKPEWTDGVKISIDRQAAADAGISDQAVKDALAKAASSTTQPATASAVDELRAMIITNTDGKRMHLGDIAAISIEKQPTMIRRDY